MEFSAFLNHDSFTLAPSIPEARSRISDFIKMYKRLTAKVPLRIELDISDHLLATDYPISRWRNDPAVEKEETSYWKILATKFPFLKDEPAAENESLSLEVHLNGILSLCCTAAYVTDGLVVSLLSDPGWDTPQLPVILKSLNDAAELVEEPVDLPHAARSTHVDHWSDWIQGRRRLHIENGSDLWKNRVILFPYLQFCDRVEFDLESFKNGNPALHQINTALARLDRETQLWEDFFRHQNVPHATPEGQATLDQYGHLRTFICPDGLKRTFSWHLRFTPGAGRLYLPLSYNEHPN